MTTERPGIEPLCTTQRLRCLSDDQLDDLQETTLRMLEEVGVRFPSEDWLDEVLHGVKPGGNFLGEPSTRDSVRRGEWYLSDLGTHGTYEAWLQQDRPSLERQLTERVRMILAEHQPLPLDERVERELDRIEAAATP